MHKESEGIHQVTPIILPVLAAGCPPCPVCGDPCIVTFQHSNSGHSCGEHFW
jgi:hypothetical protein